VARVRDVLYSPAFRSWIEGVTGVVTKPTIDCSAAKYSRGAHLLCHDDDLSTRRIAFILYLVPAGWSPEDGGSLDLYDSVSAGAAYAPTPTTVAARITPAWNSLAFFEVTPASFHSVAEVLSDAKGTRLSISGWFHSARSSRPPPSAAVAAALFPPLHPPFPALATRTPLSFTLPASHADAVTDAHNDPLSAWISPVYLARGNRGAAAEAFARDASLQLNNFLRADRLREVRKALGVARWKRAGPPHLAQYRLAASTGAPPTDPSLDAAQRLFAFLTGPRFVSFVAELAGGLSPLVSGLLRAFSHGDYTLVADPAFKAQTQARKAADKGLEAEAGGSVAEEEEKEGRQRVEVVLCLTSAEWEEEAGGYVTYLTPDEELLTVPPTPNGLSIVGLAPGVQSFVKYVSQDAPEVRYDVALTVSVLIE